MRQISRSLGLLTFLVLATPAGADPVRKITGFTPTLMDPAVDACQDFYQYACGGWLKSNPIPESQGNWSRFSELHANNMAIVSAILDKVSKNEPERKPTEQKIGDYFASCMDEAGIEARGTAPLRADLDAVEAAADRAGLARVLARLHQAGVNAVFNFGSRQDFKDADRVIAGVGPAGSSPMPRSRARTRGPRSSAGAP